MTPPYDDSRWLARHVIIDGAAYDLAVVSLTHVDGGWAVDVAKFERETHSTVFYPGTIRVTTYKDRDKKPLLEFF